MRTERPPSPRAGQAAYECAIGLFLFALVATALVEFAPVLLKNLEMQSLARVDAGQNALGATAGDRSCGGDAARITARTKVPADVTGGADAWLYPVRELPQETLFPAWRDGTVTVCPLVTGAQTKDYTFTLYYNGQAIVDHEQGELSEEVHLPALGRLSSGGGLP